DVEGLCAVLDEEARAGEALCEILRQEQRAVVGLEADIVLGCVAERRTLHHELEQLTARRRTLLLETLGDAARPTVAALLPRLPSPERIRRQPAVRRLRKALLQARSLERQNRILAGASLEVTGDLLQALRSRMPGTRYGADARLAAPAPAESLDRRA